MTSLALWYLFHHAWIELSVAHNGALFHRETSLTESPKPRNMIANPVLGPTPMGSLRNTKLTPIMAIPPKSQAVIFLTSDHWRI
ncbi:hypothetical protein SCLCIDRAFT_493039 [Scleroderma citrinum Foug A]|uniref:Secreted protein n=1 Tax=Scleroderma citrinum Foug A TaxID=1036808 RepID=A0A0C3EP25_9AGAM|nr:hypothetical protein SCLCIDRAFT_493039 [Scleroderma citrinum Foug A]